MYEICIVAVQTKKPNLYKEKLARGRLRRSGGADLLDVNVLLPPWPAGKDLARAPTPDFSGDGTCQTLVNGLCGNSATPSRNAFAESAKDSDSTRIWPTIRTPHQGRVVDVLAFQDGLVGGIVFNLTEDHRLCAVQARVKSIRRRDAHVQGGVEVAQSLGEDICWPKTRARDQVGNFSFGSGIALQNSGEKLFDHAVMTPGALAYGTASGMGGRAIQ